MPQKIILALQGNPSSGKTITLGTLYDLMKKSGYTVFQDKKRKGSKDFFVVVQKKGILIGLSTYGDAAFWIKDRCSRFVKSGCPIMI